MIKKAISIIKLKSIYIYIVNRVNLRNYLIGIVIFFEDEMFFKKIYYGTMGAKPANEK